MERNPTDVIPAGKAPSPGWRAPVWTDARKDLVGTAVGGSRVWFTVAKGVVTEVYYPRIDIPQIRDLGFLVGDGKGFWVEIKRNPGYRVEWAGDDIPAATITHQHERFTLRVRICTDPVRECLLVDFALQSEDPLGVFALLAPRLGEDHAHNEAWAGEWNGRPVLWAEGGPFGLALLARDRAGKPALGMRSAGEVGASDGWQDFARHGTMTWSFAQAGPGEVALTAALPSQGTLAIGWSSSKEAAATVAWASLMAGFDAAWAGYLESWQDWFRGLKLPPDGDAALPPPCRALLRRSATVLKVHEDKGSPGAMVASLSIPWGPANASLGGYHLVWTRDLVETAGALVALDLLDDARNVLQYLLATKMHDGHWAQNQWLGGKPFWQGIQLDETGFPILLAAQLRERGALGSVPVLPMIRRALRFIIHEGPCTGQDRWEEDPGVNTFTLAVAIAALVEGASFLSGKAAQLGLMLADYWNAHIEDWCFAEGTALAQRLGVRGYYLRAAPGDVLFSDGAKREELLIRNRQHGAAPPADEQLSTDFLQLCRYGLRRAQDPCVTASVAAVDRLLKTETPSGPTWHRYNGDGYGEHRDGTPFDGSGRGRGWPLLVGERGHYALLLGEDPVPYLQAMAAMTGPGGLLPEQVWDGDPIPARELQPGKASGSAMPLVWAHAEFIKLCLSRAAGQPVDRPPRTWARYQGQRPRADFILWRRRQHPNRIAVGQELRFLLPAPGVVHWTRNDHPQWVDTPTEDWDLGHLARLPTADFSAGDTLRFTFFWPEEGRWQGEDFTLDVSGGRDAVH